MAYGIWHQHFRLQLATCSWTFVIAFGGMCFPSTFPFGIFLEIAACNYIFCLFAASSSTELFSHFPEGQKLRGESEENVSRQKRRENGRWLGGGMGMD